MHFLLFSHLQQKLSTSCAHAVGKLHACYSIVVWLLFRHVAQALNSVEKDLKISSWQKGLPVATQRIHYSMVEPTFGDRKCLHEVMKSSG